MASTDIKIERYKNPANVDGWAGYVEPEDRAWILYFADGTTKFYGQRDKLTGAVIEPEAPTRRFIVWRHEDPTGVSGTGLVAYGWEREDGRAVVRWLGEHRTETVHEGGMASVQAIHGHAGRSAIVMADVDPETIVLPGCAMPPMFEGPLGSHDIHLTRDPDRSGWLVGQGEPCPEWSIVKAGDASWWSPGSVIGPANGLVHGELIEGFTIDGEQRLVFEEMGGVLISSRELPSGTNTMEVWASEEGNRRVRRDFEWHEVVELLALRPTEVIVTRLTGECGGDPAYHRIPI